MIQDIINTINDSIDNCTEGVDFEYYNIAYTIDVNGKKYPVTPNGSKAIKICPNDKFNLQIFHKITTHTFRERQDIPAGRNIAYEVETGVKMIVIMKSALSIVNPAYNPENFAHLIPQKITLPPDYKSIRTSINSVITDHDLIVNREWKDISYSKHKCKFKVFEVNYTIRAITCKLSCTSYLLHEDMYKMLQENSSALLLE